MPFSSDYPFEDIVERAFQLGVDPEPDWWLEALDEDIVKPSADGEYEVDNGDDILTVRHGDMLFQDDEGSVVILDGEDDD